MRCSLLLTLVALLAAPAWAQTPGASATTNSNSTSTGQAVANNQPIQSITNNGSGRISTAPAIFAPAMSPTAPCTSVLSAGVSVVGFGLSLGGNYEDKECTRREYARVLAQMGFSDAGLAMLCGNDEVRRTAPQLCTRSDYVNARPETYVGSEPPVMPPAPIRPNKPAPPPGPAIGQIGYDPNGNRMIYNGAAWTVEQAAAGAVTTNPLKMETVK